MTSKPQQKQLLLKFILEGTKMKKLMQDSGYLPRSFKIFIAVVTLLSIFGGYQLSQLIYRMNDFYLQRAEQLLAMEGNLDDAAIALGRQIQEWKDMLLRANDIELFSKHRKAFSDSGVRVQEALLRTKTAMQNDGMDTGEIEQLIYEHQSLLSDYLIAQTMLNPRQIDSFREVDKQVIGVDRNLQQHIAIVKTDIVHFSKQQLNGTMPAQGNRYLLGLLGGLSLLIMSLVGFFFASHFQGNRTRMAGQE